MATLEPIVRGEPACEQTPAPTTPLLDPEELPGGRKAVPLRALAFSLAAMGTSTWGALSSPELLAGYDALSWLLALIPGFLLAYYRGWHGATRTMAGGALFVLVVELGAQSILGIEPNWLLLFFVTLVLLGVGLGLGVLAELFRRERVAAVLSANADPLVGLPNRRLLDFLLDKAFAAAERGDALALVVFDVDGFQAYEERHGRRKGIEALRRIANILARETRRMNTTGRYGRYEFLSILSGTSVEGAQVFAERIRRSVAEIELHRETPLTLAAGIAAHEPRMRGPAELLEAARKALHRARTLGGNCHCVYEATADEALRRKEEHFQLLIERASDVITILDANGNVRYHSPAVERILGYPPGELSRRRLWSHVHAEDRDRLKQWAARAVRTPGSTPRVEYRFRHRDGSWSTLESIGNNLLDDPLVAGWVVYTREITERKRLEEQLRQSQKMEVVGRLAGGVAHDFNNLLTAITCHSQFLLADLPSDNPLRLEAEEIKSAADRAASLTRQLLVFSRKQVAQAHVLDLNAVVSELEKLLKRLIGEDIELVTRLDPRLEPVRVNRGHLEQTILNLAVNARDAMPDGGRLQIETRRFELHESSGNGNGSARGSYAVLTVEDTGCGMHAEVQARIFEPFFTTKEEGTGLGLATAYGIVKQAGGSIRVKSEPGGGTTFTIFLPTAQDEAPAPPAEPKADRTPRGTEVVLLVEDEDAVRTLAGRILRERGYTVLDAPDAAAALERARAYEGPIHLLLTDVVMPGLNGPELANRLAATRPDARCLYMSGYTDNPLVREEIQQAGAAFLPKPFTIDGLARAVRETLDTSRGSTVELKA